jgi:hypothetical protein
MNIPTLLDQNDDGFSQQINQILGDPKTIEEIITPAQFTNIQSQLLEILNTGFIISINQLFKENQEKYTDQYARVKFDVLIADALANCFKDHEALKYLLVYVVLNTARLKSELKWLGESLINAFNPQEGTPTDSFLPKYFKVFSRTIYETITMLIKPETRFGELVNLGKWTFQARIFYEFLIYAIQDLCKFNYPTIRLSLY